MRLEATFHMININDLRLSNETNRRYAHGVRLIYTTNGPSLWADLGPYPLLTYLKRDTCITQCYNNEYRTGEPGQQTKGCKQTSLS